jgi:regulator of replication initiation timing
MKEEMQARIHSIQSELENTNQQTKNLRKELTEAIEKNTG